MHIPANTWSVIPEVVVREIRLPVVVLPREPQREVKARSGVARTPVGNVVTKRLLLIPPPHRRTGAVCNQPRCVRMINLTTSKRNQNAE